jgi:undecaprenyl diphosphate synthase
MPKTVKVTVPRGTKVPDHIAIIPDGNRRWARSRGLPTLMGHKKGFDRAVQVSRAARDLGIHTVTLWGFSTENWDRSRKEIGYLMKLYEKLIDDYLAEADKDGVRIIHLGRKDRIPGFLLKKLLYAEEKTKDNNKYIMNIAIDYGGQDDILRAVQKMVRAGVKENEVDKTRLEYYLDTHGQPYPYVDLMIRTSGEQRTSGFLLWQSAYTETYWVESHFPDFTPDKLKEAVLDFSRRRRRFGGNDTVEHFDFKPELVANLELAWWRLSKVPKGTRLRDYAVKHLREQYHLSKELALKAAKHMVIALAEEENGKNWENAKKELKEFYKIIKGELKLAFEPSLVASLEVQLIRESADKNDIRMASEAEETAKNLYAEVYRLSLLQAAKLAHLRVMANIERNLAESGAGETHWVKAEDYLEKFYKALKERVA